MNDPFYNAMLKWGVQNSDTSQNVPSAETPRQISPSKREVFDEVMAYARGPSAPKQVDRNLDIIESKESSAEDKYEAFETIEDIIAQIDNAHSLENENRWTRLIDQLENDDPEIRGLASQCCRTAVQNNIRSQERLLIMGGIPTLVRLATADSEPPMTRMRATNALSSVVRNFQPGLEAVLSHLPAEHKPEGKPDASNMDSVDIFINKLKESILT